MAAIPVKDKTVEIEVFDKSEALERLAGNESLLKEMANIFLNNYSDQLAEIIKAIGGKDGEALELSAHSLRGDLKSLGADAASAPALQLEVMGRENNMASAQEAYTLLEDEVVRLNGYLHDFVAGDET